MKQKPKKQAKTTRDRALSLVEDVLGALHQIAMDADAPASARVSACKELLDRAEGRPSQSVKTTITDTTSDKFNVIANQLRLELLGTDG